MAERVAEWPRGGRETRRDGSRQFRSRRQGKGSVIADGGVSQCQVPVLAKGGCVNFLTQRGFDLRFGAGERNLVPI